MSRLPLKRIAFAALCCVLLSVASVPLTVAIGIGASLPRPMLQTDQFPPGRGSVFYEFELIADSDQLGADSFEPGVSVNSHGEVAFISNERGENGVHTEQINVSNGDGNIYVLADPGEGFDFGQYVQINDDHIVAARYLDTFTSPAESRIRLYDRNDLQGPANIVAKAKFVDRISSPIAYYDWDYDTVFGPVSIMPRASASTGENVIVFAAQEGHDLLSDCDDSCLVAYPPTATGKDFWEEDVPLVPVYLVVSDLAWAVAKVGQTPTSPIVLYDLVDAEKIVADDTIYEAIGSRPGIDYQAVAFSGIRSGIPGIYLYHKPTWDWNDDSRLQTHYVLNFTDETPAMGIAADGTPITMQEIDLDAAINIVAQDSGIDGDNGVGDRYDILFMGTPSAASATNPQTGQPLLFSDQPGLWVVQSTVISDTLINDVTLANSSPRPVVQINDRIVVHSSIGPKQYTMTDLAIHDSLAHQLPTHERNGHYIAFWAATAEGTDIIVRASYADRDRDGLADHWETRGLDIDHDNVIDLDLPAMEADVNRPDIFLEIDALKSHNDTLYINDLFLAARLIRLFEGQEMKLHVDLGPYLSLNMGHDDDLLQGGDQICTFTCNLGGEHVDYVYFGKPGSFTPPRADENARSFHELKQTFFGTEDKGARELVFHYTIIADKIATSDGRNLGGMAEGTLNRGLAPHPVPGNDILIGTNGGPFRHPNYPTDFFLVQQILHGLGLNLGLRPLAANSSLPPAHPHHTPGRYDPKHKSVMNYAYHIGLYADLQTMVNDPGDPSSSEVLLQSAPYTGKNGQASLGGLPFRIVAGPAARAHDYSIRTNGEDFLGTNGHFPQLATEGTAVVLHQGFAATDWPAMQLDFQNYYQYMGHTLFAPDPPDEIDGAVRAAGQTAGEPYLDLDLLEAELGPFDRQVPTLILNAPTANLTVSQGGTIDIAAVATDDLALAGVTVAFDGNGDGTEETVVATGDGVSTYSATLANITGPAGERILSVTARDTVSRTTVVTRTVRVDGAPAATNTPSAPSPTPTATTPGVQPTPTRDSNNPAGLLYLPIIHGGGLVNSTPVATPTPTPTATNNPDGATTTPTLTPITTSPPDSDLLPPTPQNPPPVIGAGVSSGAVRGFDLGTVTALAFSPDGARLALGGDGGGVIITDAVTGDTIQQLAGHTAAVNDLAFSPAGDQLLTGSSDGTARLWEPTTGNLIRSFARADWQHNDQYMAVAFSPDGTQILAGVAPLNSTASSEKTVALLWNAATGALLRIFDGHTQGVLAVAFSPTGDRILTGSMDNSARLWNTATGELLRTFSGHTGYVLDVAFAPDGNRIATASRDGSSRLWDINSGAFQTLDDSAREAFDLAFFPDGTRLIIGSGNGEAQLWDTQSATLLHRYAGHAEAVRAVTFTPNGSELLTASEDGEVRRWNATVAAPRILEGHTDQVLAVAVSPDGSTILSGSRDDTAKLWAADTGNLLHTLAGHTGDLYAVAFSPDGSQALTGGDDRTIRLWATATGTLIRTFEGHTQRIAALAFSPDSSQILSGSCDRTARLWDKTTGTVIRTFSGHTGQIVAAGFAADGTRIMTVGGDRTVRVWDVATGNEIAKREEPATNLLDGVYGNGQILYGNDAGLTTLWNPTTDRRRLFLAQSKGGNGVALAQDGRYVLTGHRDSRARLWDVASGEMVNLFATHIAPNSPVINSVALSPDGALAVVGSADGNVYLWPTQAGIALESNSRGGHNAAVDAVVFSPDGRYLVSAGQDKRAIVWDAQTQRPLRRLLGHRDRVQSLAIWPDSSKVVTGGGLQDATAHIWDLATGEIVRSIPMPTSNNAVLGLAVSPDGTQIAAATQRNEIHLYASNSGARIRTFNGHTRPVNAVAFSPDGTRLLSGGDDNVALLWDVNSGANAGSFGGHTEAVVDVHFTPDGTHTLTVSKDGTARLWNLATGSTVQTFGVRSRATAGTGYHPLTSGAFSPDGSQLILGDESYRAQLWDVASGELLRSFEGHTQAVRAVAFAPNGEQVVTGGGLHDNTLWLWDTANGTLVRNFTGHDVREINDGAISPDGSQILTGACDETARLWDVGNGAQLHSFPGHFDEVPCAMAVAFAADGIHALTTTPLSAHLWDLASRTKLRTIRGHHFAMNSATLSPDGSQLLTTGSDRSPARCSQDCAQAKLWNTADGALLHTLVHPTVLYDAVFSADGTLVMTVGTDQQLRLWSAASGQLLRTVEVHTDAIWAAAFSLDGTQLLTGGDDQTALLIDLASSTVVHTFQHPAQVRDVTFHPNSNLVAVAAGWNVYLWDAERGGLVAVVGHGDAVQSVGFAADGTQLLTTGWDGAAKLWAVGN